VEPVTPSVWEITCIQWW